MLKETNEELTLNQTNSASKKYYPAGIYLLKINNNTRTKYEIISKDKDIRTTLLASFWCLYC